MDSHTLQYNPGTDAFAYRLVLEQVDRVAHTNKRQKGGKIGKNVLDWMEIFKQRNKPGQSFMREGGESVCTLTCVALCEYLRRQESFDRDIVM